MAKDDGPGNLTYWVQVPPLLPHTVTPQTVNNVSIFHICNEMAFLDSKIPFQHQILYVFDQRGIIMETPVIS